MQRLSWRAGAVALLARSRPSPNAVLHISCAPHRTSEIPSSAAESILFRMAKRGLGPGASSSDASPVRVSTAEAVEEVELAVLCAHSPSVALRRCLPGICPWCTLRCRHGDVVSAVESFKRRRSDLPTNCSRGSFMLMHCKRWIMELTSADMRGELAGPETATEVLDSSLAPVFNTFSAAVASSSASRSSTDGGGPCPRLPEQRAGAIGFPPPPPPPGLEGLAAGLSQSTLPPPPPPPVAHGAQWRPSGVFGAAQPWAPVSVWQYWAGKRTKWQDYSAEVSASLTFMAAHGPAEADFMISGASYRINVEEMTQNNKGTDQPPRAIRVRPVDEAD